MLLRIDLNDDIWIADVGFGTQTLTAPLRLHENGVQDTPHGAFRLEAMGPEFNQQSNWSGAWETHYSFTLDEQILDDYEASNWYRATHPQSPFVNNLMCARPLGLQRFGLLNDVFTVRNADGSEPKRRILRDPDELMDVLEDSFGLTLPAPRADLATKLARVFGHEHSLK
jgi:N-hydroxyarylamine O-acetyltransferase